MVPDLLVVDLDQYNENFNNNHKHSKRILKTKNIYIGWGGFVAFAQSEEKERARAGLTSDISLGSLAFDDNAFSVRSRL